MPNCKTDRTHGRHTVKYVSILLMVAFFSMFLFGCRDEKINTAVSGAIPENPEECITNENLLFSDYEAVVATVGGDCSESYKLYKYTETEVILVRYTCDSDGDTTKSYRIVPSTVVYDCMKLTKKYKMGTGKWLNGDAITGMEFRIYFIKDGEAVSVSSESMPDNGMDAFDAVAKVLGQAWNQA